LRFNILLKKIVLIKIIYLENFFFYYNCIMAPSKSLDKSVSSLLLSTQLMITSAAASASAVTAVNTLQGLLESGLFTVTDIWNTILELSVTNSSVYAGYGNIKLLLGACTERIILNSPTIYSDLMALTSCDVVSTPTGTYVDQLSIGGGNQFGSFGMLLYVAGSVTAGSKDLCDVLLWSYAESPQITNSEIGLMLATFLSAIPSRLQAAGATAVMLGDSDAYVNAFILSTGLISPATINLTTTAVVSVTLSPPTFPTTIIALNLAAPAVAYYEQAAGQTYNIAANVLKYVKKMFPSRYNASTMSRMGIPWQILALENEFVSDIKSAYGLSTSDISTINTFATASPTPTLTAPSIPAYNRELPVVAGLATSSSANFTAISLIHHLGFSVGQYLASAAGIASTGFQADMRDVAVVYGDLTQVSLLSRVYKFGASAAITADYLIPSDKISDLADMYQELRHSNNLPATPYTYDPSAPSESVQRRAYINETTDNWIKSYNLTRLGTVAGAVALAPGFGVTGSHLGVGTITTVLSGVERTGLTAFDSMIKDDPNAFDIIKDLFFLKSGRITFKSLPTTADAYVTNDKIYPATAGVGALTSPSPVVAALLTREPQLFNAETRFRLLAYLAGGDQRVIADSIVANEKSLDAPTGNASSSAHMVNLASSLLGASVAGSLPLGAWSNGKLPAESLFDSYVAGNHSEGAFLTFARSNFGKAKDVVQAKLAGLGAGGATGADSVSIFVRKALINTSVVDAPFVLSLVGNTDAEKAQVLKAAMAAADGEAVHKFSKALQSLEFDSVYNAFVNNFPPHIKDLPTLYPIGAASTTDITGATIGGLVVPLGTPAAASGNKAVALWFMAYFKSVDGLKLLAAKTDNDRAVAMAILSHKTSVGIVDPITGSFGRAGDVTYKTVASPNNVKTAFGLSASELDDILSDIQLSL